MVTSTLSLHRALNHALVSSSLTPVTPIVLLRQLTWNYITSSSRNDLAYESAEFLKMEPVAQCLTRIVRQTEQVQALAKSASVTLASPQSDEPNRVTAQE
jgi:hypothetical protein